MTDAVHIDAALLSRLTAHMETSGLSWKHVRNTVAYLKHWRRDLGHVDLNHVTRREIQEALAKHKTARAHRIIALKTLGAFLVDSGRMDPAVSPARHVKVPVPVAAQATRAKGYTATQMQECYGRIANQAVRDTVRLQALYGMHATEVARVAKSLAAVTTVEDAGEIVGVISFPHKNRQAHSVSVDSPALAAALRLQARGRAPGDHQMLDAMTPLKPGELRHSFVQLGQHGRWAYPQGQGISVDEVAAVTGHSSSTARKFYNGGVPRMLVLPFTLESPLDPPAQLPARGKAGGSGRA